MDGLSTKFDLDAITERFERRVDEAVEAALAGPGPSKLTPTLNKLRADACREMFESIRPPSPRRHQEAQSVYFIQVGTSGPIKVGIAVDVEQRLRDLQCGSPYRLRLLATAEGGRRYELELHRRFAEHGLEGEWFEPVDDLLRVVAGHV